MTEKEILKQFFPYQKKYIHKRISRSKLINEMINLEFQFNVCNKIENPRKWFYLQDKLADIYKRIMIFYKL
jgi:hypothetical protein